MRDRMKDEHYFIILSQKERKNIIMFEDAVKKTTLEKGELDRGTRCLLYTSPSPRDCS